MITDAGVGTGVTIVSVLGVIGAAIAGTYQRFLSANVKADAQRLDNAIKNCEQRCMRLEANNTLLHNRISELESEKSRWQARYESLAESLKRSPPPKEIA
jgi:predicted RNase H-like nuclease (RuvC/YqgF family)